MMRVVTAIFFIAQAHATELPQISDELADKLIDKLANKLFGTAISARSLPMAAMQGKYMGQAAAASVWPLATSRPKLSTNALPLNYRQPAAVSPLTNYRPQAPGGDMSVQQMQDALKSYAGISPSPLQKLALTAIVGTRDVSMAAQARNMLANLDAKTKKMVTQAEAAVESKYKDMAGVTAPMNFWDPWGISTGKCTDEEVLFYREVELKHGRVGMLAWIGILMGEKVAPLFGAAKVPAAMVFQQAPNEPAFWLIALIVVTSLEYKTLYEFGSSERFMATAKKNKWTLTDGRVPGDFGFDPLNLKPKEPAKLLEMQNKELNNGRLAMIAAAGVVAQELATDSKVFDIAGP